MKKFLSAAGSKIKNGYHIVKGKVMYALAFIVSLFMPGTSFAQSLAGTGYEAGTSALEEVAAELIKYIPYVVNLCYALAGIFAIVGAISVYIAMI